MIAEKKRLLLQWGTRVRGEVRRKNTQGEGGLSFIIMEMKIVFGETKVSVKSHDNK